MKLHFWALAALTLANTHALAAAPGETCVRDLRAITPFLLENDTGARAHLAQKGQAYFDLALATASTAAASAADDKACNAILGNYLGMWRKSHLYVKPGSVQEIAKPAPARPNVASQAAPSKEPALQILSDATVLLSLPSFHDPYRAAVAALLDTHRAVLAARPNWIIDVRRNAGGSDSTYAPLLQWISSDEMVSVGAEWLSTPANIASQEKICALVAPGDQDCIDFATQAVKQMRTVKPGDYVPQENDELISYARVSAQEPRRPARVAVLMDSECASSCEEFLLAARQSFHVKLIGRNSEGALDYSNLRLHALPSGVRELQYATSRSARLPHLQVDLGGIMPDIYLPPPKDEAGRAQEIVRVQRWLEGGTLRPNNI
ncbi:S41 family peptidase [Janthinobacterium sp. GMG1]|uniref:S41 family peptidase n=1 Tax=Janthinobacterium sp. GMG1 TaxID=3096007 RepID=UPI002ACA444D|nr:S41 family peptidase [Janthinobacterium sp. GMG1]MDZ5635869.1 S41 family peptidase [Janthinobacterium sp. GMG1]